MGELGKKWRETFQHPKKKLRHNNNCNWNESDNRRKKGGKDIVAYKNIWVSNVYTTYDSFDFICIDALRSYRNEICVFQFYWDNNSTYK